jgi:hypothetical protein
MYIKISSHTQYTPFDRNVLCVTGNFDTHYEFYTNRDGPYKENYICRYWITLNWMNFQKLNTDQIQFLLKYRNM